MGKYRPFGRKFRRRAKHNICKIYVSVDFIKKVYRYKVVDPKSVHLFRSMHFSSKTNHYDTIDLMNAPLLSDIWSVGLSHRHASL